MKRNVGKVINIINVCFFYLYIGKKVFCVKRLNCLYWFYCVVVGLGLVLSLILLVFLYKKV